MNAYTIKVRIDGVDYSQKELEKVSEFRIKHVLTEMKHLGADVTLTDEEIQFLPYQKARKILFDLKKTYDYQGMTDLYARPLQSSDEFWHRVAKASHGREELKEGKVHLSVEGMTMPQLQAVLGDELNSDFSYIVNPEHFYSEGSVSTGQHIIETFGCFGEPIDMTLHIEEDGFTPVAPNPDYPIRINGYSKLYSDGLDFDGAFRAFHQIRPTEKGFDAILATYLPSAVPDEMIEGHKLHLAIEFSEMIKYAMGDIVFK